MEVEQHLSFPSAFQETVRFHCEQISDLQSSAWSWTDLGFIGLGTESAKVSDLSVTPPSASQDMKVADWMRGLSLISALSPIQLKTAASRNDPPIKTLGLKLQNNSMTTSVRSRNSILSASACSMRRVCGISRLQKTLSLVLVLPISLATSIFAPLRHLKPIRGALLQPHLQICCAQEQVQGDPSWERLTCHVFTARCTGATPTTQSTTDLFLQHVTRQAARVSRLRPAAPWSNTQSTAPVLWKLKRDLRGPWVKVSNSKIGWDTYTNPWNTWNQAEYRKLNSTSPFHLLSRRLSDFTANVS